MFRRPFRRFFRLESLESREMLTAGGPSAEAQYMLDLINMTRTSPQQAADWVVSHAKADSDVMATLKYYNVDLQQVHDEIAASAPRPPLAWSDTLAGTATAQSQYQMANGVQSHTGTAGSTLSQRLDAAGYGNRVSAGENAYAYSKSVDHAMEAFLIDWGVASDGHRDNILEPNSSPEQYYREVGIGVVKSTNPNVGPVVITQDFGHQSGARAQVLGVAYNDPGHTHQFADGSGVGNVEVDVTNSATGQTQTTQTWDAGGYQVAVDPGTYTVTAKVNGQVVNSSQVTVSDQNVEVDFDMNDPWQGAPPATAAANKTTAASAVASQQTVSSAGGTADTSSSFQTSWVSWTATKV
jgi:uncharacterized protein YkwD